MGLSKKFAACFFRIQSSFKNSPNRNLIDQFLLKINVLSDLFVNFVQLSSGLFKFYASYFPSKTIDF